MSFQPAGYFEEEDDEEDFIFGDELGKDFALVKEVKVTQGPAQDYGEVDQQLNLDKKSNISQPVGEVQSGAESAPSNNKDNLTEIEIPSGPVLDTKCPTPEKSSGHVRIIETSNGWNGASCKQKKTTHSNGFFKRLESSSDIRIAIAKGDVEQVARLLDDGT